MLRCTYIACLMNKNDLHEEERESGTAILKECRTDVRNFVQYIACVCLWARMCACVRACMCVRARVRMCVCARVCMCVRARVYVCV